MHDKNLAGSGRRCALVLPFLTALTWTAPIAETSVDSSLIQSPAATLVRRDAPGGGDETRLNRAAGPRGSSYSRLPEADAAGDDVRPSGAVEPPELEVTFPTNNFSVLEGETRDMVVRLNRPIDYYLDPGLAGPEEGVLPDLP